MKRVLILIPARYQSSRFPGKPLAPLKNKPLIQHVVEKASEVSIVNGEIEVAVVTDHSQIEKTCLAFGAKVIRVDDDTPSGTDRIFLAWDRNPQFKDVDLIVNVQGDEPFISPNDLTELIEEHLASQWDIGTMVREISGEDADSPNLVKSIYSEASKKCLYFSRAKIPYNRDNRETKYFGHVGVYSYLPKSLQRFCELPPGNFEQSECLEQLRALEAEMTIGAIKINTQLIGVDTPEDLKKAEEVLHD